MSDKTNVKRKTAKLFVAAGFLLLLALLVFVQAAFDLNPFMRTSLKNQTALLVTLSTLIFLVMLVFGFVLLRNIVKVWEERKQQKPGSKFKTSLLMVLGVLTLIPAISLFAFAYGLVNRSIDKWFSAPVNQIFDATREINEEWRLQHESMILGLLTHLGTELPADFDGERKLFGLKALLVVDPAGQVDMFSADPGIAKDAIARNVLAAIGTGNEAFAGFQADWIGAKRIDTPTGRKVLAAIFPTPPRIAELSSAISSGQARYGQLIQNQRSFRDTYVYMYALMTLLVLFAAVWLGIFLSKRITVPIEALAEATREISAGNLDYRVDIKAADELGMLVTLFNDMAAQLQGTTAELETRRRYMEVILESIPTGVISLDTDLHVNTLNRAARTMFSVEMANRLDDIFKSADLQEVLDLLSEAKEDSITREISFVTPGRPAHSAVTVSRLSTGGFVLVVEDLTEVVRAHKASAWREVARRLAHEIKNPLTPIQLSAERIGRNIARLPAAPPRVTEVIQECVLAIVDEVSSLKNLVNEFVRFARLPAVSRLPNSMRELIDKTMALYDGRMEGVSVAIAVSDELPPILMDSMQMKRVLINLIDNALQAMSTEPVRELNIACELARDGTMARLTIEDTGRGIDPEDRERLFTPYFSTRKNGTGLGLSIASRIVADHGGYIGAEPNSPRGTRFVIELPLCQESSLSTTSPAFGSR